jgi:hypothetical protein
MWYERGDGDPAGPLALSVRFALAAWYSSNVL